MGASCVRWTGDTERAFLLALRQTGQVVRAAAAIGRATGVCYDRRRRVAAFAQAWDEALAEMEGERLGEAAEASGTALAVRPLTRARRDGWTQQRQRSFVRALADTGSYGQAAQQVGISMTSVQRLRRRSEAFQALCDTALVEGGTTLEEAVYLRATEGWEEAIYQDGKLVGHRRRFSDTLAKVLLERDRPVAPGRGGRVLLPQADPEDALAALERQLDAMERAQARDERRGLVDWAERMAAEGWAP